jgi:pimeloyl-ACP methyl ester carboxylesterase
MLRYFSSKFLNQATDKVQLRGRLLKSTSPDMPTIIAFPDLLENPEALRPLFNKKLLDFRNVWLLSYRNSWNSDFNPSMEPEEIANDVIRFMDKNKITTASLIGSGFGGRIAAQTGILKYHRITSVVALDYSPMDLIENQAYKNLKQAIEATSKIHLSDRNSVESQVRKLVNDSKLHKVIMNNLAQDESKSLYWRSAFPELAAAMNDKDSRRNIGKFPLIGIFPGRALFLYAERSQWVHQSSNTIPIYNLFPVLYGEYGKFINHYDTDAHNLYESVHVTSIARKLADFYRWYDGVHLLLRDRSEIGKVSLPIRGRTDLAPNEKNQLDEIGDPTIPKAIPIHRHHNWGYIDEKIQIP